MEESKSTFESFRLPAFHDSVDQGVLIMLKVFSVNTELIVSISVSYACVEYDQLDSELRLVEFLSEAVKESVVELLELGCTVIVAAHHAPINYTRGLHGTCHSS